MKRLLTLSLAALLAAGLTACGAAEERGVPAAKPVLYLVWEGITEAEYDFSTGFCVAGEDTAAFLEDALDRLGLTEREADEFIIYWLPKLEGNPYNLLSFQTDAYTNSAALTIDPAPDTLIRVFLAWKGLDAPVEVEPQKLTAPERAGFTAVEWGGAEVVQ